MFIALSLMLACIDIQRCASLLALNKIKVIQVRLNREVNFQFSIFNFQLENRTLKTEQSKVMKDKREIGYYDDRLEKS